MSLNKNTIITFLQNNRQKLADEYHVSKLALFGSYAKSCNSDDSDIDLLVDGQNMRLDEMRIFLEQEFGKKVDLVKERSLYHFMKCLIQKEAVYVD